jgi:hypothetical protein
MDDHGIGIVGPSIQTNEQVVASYCASSLDGESADARRLLDLRETPPVDHGQSLDRFRQIVRTEDLGPVDRKLFIDAGLCMIRNPDRPRHVVAARASSSDLVIASGSRATALASEASAAGDKGREAIESLARAVARLGSTIGMVSAGSMPSTLSRHPDNDRDEALTPATSALGSAGAEGPLATDRDHAATVEPAPLDFTIGGRVVERSTRAITPAPEHVGSRFPNGDMERLATARSGGPGRS